MPGDAQSRPAPQRGAVHWRRVRRNSHDFSEAPQTKRLTSSTMRTSQQPPCGCVAACFEVTHHTQDSTHLLGSEHGGSSHHGGRDHGNDDLGHVGLLQRRAKGGPVSDRRGECLSTHVWTRIRLSAPVDRPAWQGGCWRGRVLACAWALTCTVWRAGRAATCLEASIFGFGVRVRKAKRKSVEC